MNRDDKIYFSKYSSGNELNILCRDIDWKIRENVSKNLNASIEILMILSKDNYKTIRDNSRLQLIKKFNIR